MNKQEKEWLDYYKECNDLDYAQIERFEPKVQEEILRTKLLIEIIEKQEDRIKTQNEVIILQNKKIESFETGEMKIGTRIETNS